MVTQMWGKALYSMALWEISKFSFLSIGKCDFSPISSIHSHVFIYIDTFLLACCHKLLLLFILILLLNEIWMNSRDMIA